MLYGSTASSFPFDPYIDKTGRGDVTLIKMGEIGEKETEAQRGEVTCPRAHSE